MRGAQAAHHGVAVEVPLRIAPRAERDRDRGQDHGKHGGESEEALGAVQARAHFGPRVVQAVDALAPAEAGSRPLLELPDSLALTRGEKLIADAASGLHQARGGQIIELHHQPRREVHERHSAVGFERQHRAGAKARPAELDRVTRAHLERRHHAFVEPHRAPRRNGIGVRVREIQAGGDAQLSAQGVARRHRLHRREERLVARARHADEIHAFGSAQPAPRDLVAKFRGPRMVGRHQHVGTEHLVRFARERLPHAVGEEGDTGYAANGEHEPERKHAQLPRASVAQEHAEGETQHGFSPRRRSGRRRAGFSGGSGRRSPRRASPARASCAPPRSSRT